jgi:NADPH:quinone reductase
MPHAIQIRQTGGPEVLNWTAVDVGEPGSGQARLRQAAAGLNFIDVYHRTGYYSQPLNRPRRRNQCERCRVPRWSIRSCR